MNGPDPAYRGRLSIRILDHYQMYGPVVTGTMEESRNGAIVLRLDEPRKINGNLVERVFAWPSAVASWRYEEGGQA